MQQLFVLKRADGADHVIGRLTQTDGGGFDVEDLLAEPGSERLALPVFTDKGKNNEKLMNWIISFMPPLGNDRFMQMLTATLGVGEFDPIEWLKLYKPGGGNTISFCEKIPFGCVVHCSDIPPADFAFIQFAEDDEDDCPPYEPVLPYVDDEYPYEPLDEYDEYDEYDEFDDYRDEELLDHDYDYDDEEDEEVPIVISQRRKCSELPVFPENIPAEEPITDMKAFSKTHGKSKVDDLRTIHNTLCALVKMSVEDFIDLQDVEPLAAAAHLQPEKLKETTLGEFAKLHGYLICEHSDISDYITKECIDLFGHLSRNIRAAAVQKSA